ncbi:hypothetical protein B0H19DRAFT_1238657 [Mycena capillaripes]|nr:hypothetical protein B0H19DRAFT_1238657 [Mycena capillaripes]
MSKATFVIVPVIAHPTIGPLASTAPPNADAANLRRVLERLINDEQKEVVLFCHSYGGIPGSQSVNGLERSKREKAAQKGGILKVFYLSAVLPREGESLLQTLTAADVVPPDWMEMDPATGTFIASPKATAILFHDCRMTKLRTGPQSSSPCLRTSLWHLQPMYAGERTFHRCTYSAKMIAYFRFKTSSGWWRGCGVTEEMAWIGRHTKWTVGIMAHVCLVHIVYKLRRFHRQTAETFRVTGCLKSTFRR